AVNRVAGVLPGLYHYSGKEHGLVLLREGLIFPRIEALAERPQDYQAAAATVIMTVTFGRTGFKYRGRAYRYVNMDAGHAAYNLGVAAAASGLAAPVVMRFDDAALNALLEIDGETEAALLLMPLGRPLADEGARHLPEPAFVSAVAGASDETARSYTSAIHAASSLRRAESFAPEAALARLAPHPRAASYAPRGLGAPAEGGDLLAAIRARRSVREYSDRPMETAELCALCAAAQGALAEGERSLLAPAAPLSLYVAVRDVAGMEPGVYFFDPAARTLDPVRHGDVSAQCRSAALDQDFCGAADAVFIKTARWSELLAPDGDRGYRYACIQAGVMGGGLYLQATALGLGACGVGAFTDPDVATVVGCDPDVEAPLYLTAVGK
ncbi:MAG: SagB family peptide dehydrogenase, partial [Planctomycetes bacterium]|nr:SagB family peptide dehydrogenase [Planctomycetota bacterium]